MINDISVKRILQNDIIIPDVVEDRISTTLAGLGTSLKSSQYETSNTFQNNTNRFKMRKTGLRAATIAAVICTLILGTATALAVSGIIDLSVFYDSIFRSEQAAPYVVGEDGITEVVNEQTMPHIIDDNAVAVSIDELDIKLVASLVTERTAYIEMELSGENIPDTLYLFYHDIVDETPEDNLPGVERVWSLSDTAPLITRLSENTVRVSMTLSQEYFTYFAFSEDDRELTALRGLLVFDTISSKSNPADANAVLFTGDWRFEFNITGASHIGYTFDIGDYWGWLGISATEVVISIHSYDGFESGFSYPYENDGALELVLFDGTIITPRFSSKEIILSSSPNQYVITYEMEFIDPGSIESVIFCGEILEDSKRPGDGGA